MVVSNICCLIVAIGLVFEAILEEKALDKFYRSLEDSTRTIAPLFVSFIKACFHVALAIGFVDFAADVLRIPVPSRAIGVVEGAVIVVLGCSILLGIIQVQIGEPLRKTHSIA